MEHVVQTIEMVEARIRDNQKLINQLCALGEMPVRYPHAELAVTQRLAPAAAETVAAPTRKGKWGGARKKKEARKEASSPQPPPQGEGAKPRAAFLLEAPEGETLPEAQRRIVGTIAEPFTVRDILALLPAAIQVDEADALKKLSANCSYWRKTGKLEWASQGVGTGPASYNRTKDWALA